MPDNIIYFILLISVCLWDLFLMGQVLCGVLGVALCLGDSET